MSIYTLPPMAEQRLASLVTHGGADTLQLQRPQNSLSVLVIAEHEHDKLQLSIGIGGQHSTLTLQAGDRANTQHAADYIEALANGTAETALEPAVVKQSFTTGPDQSGEAADMVNHPPHYNGHPSGVECIEVTEQLPFNLGNAFKYVFRHRAKNGREDLHKARWYLAREQERSERSGISIGHLQAVHTLAERIAAHEPYPVGAALVAIAADEPAEALYWIEHLLAA